MNLRFYELTVLVGRILSMLPQDMNEDGSGENASNKSLVGLKLKVENDVRRKMK